jgi:hypothetical protein
MIPFIFGARAALRVSTAALAFVMASRILHAQLPATATTRLDSLERLPDIAGTAIYRGSVFPLHGNTTDTLYTYERRVAQDMSMLRVAHITRTLQRRVIIEESAVCAADYALQRFDAVNAQAGFVGSAVVSADGRRVDFRLERDGRVTTASQDIDAPVVAGPTVHGFIRAHWDQLISGSRLKVRMIVMTRTTTYGFDVRAAPAANGTTTFTVTPSSMLIRLVVAPLRVTFDTARNVVRYEGRVPPMRFGDGKWHDLDARVDYTMLVPEYR